LTDRGVLLAEGVQGKPSGARTVSPASKPRLCLRLFTGSDGQLHQCDKRYGHDLGTKQWKDLDHYSELDRVAEYTRQLRVQPQQEKGRDLDSKCDKGVDE
jgi:hypothetical protein